MRCPYCTEEISDQALVCAHCTRDLYLFRPLLEKISALEKQIETGTTDKIRALEERLASMERSLAGLNSVPMANSAPAVQAADPVAADAAIPDRSFALSSIIGFLVPLVLLLAAHLLVIVVYDLKPLYLRIASLLLPLPFAFAFYVWHPRRMLASTALALVTAIAAVLGMSALTGVVDKTPVLPQDLREVREMVEYAASIMFSFVTGLLLGKIRYRRLQVAAPAPNRMFVFAAQLFTTDKDGEMGLHRVAKRISQIAGAVTPAITAIAAAWTGLKAFLDQ